MMVAINIIIKQKKLPKVQVWVKELRKMLGDKVCLRIVGNKLDLEKDRNVPIEMAERLNILNFLI